MCRSDPCDLHFTTDVLFNADLKDKCVEKFAAGKGAKCCASDFTLQELQTLCATMDMEVDVTADTAAAYLKLSDDAWRTTVYQDGICSPVMSHADFITLAKELNVKIVSGA